MKPSYIIEKEKFKMNGNPRELGLAEEFTRPRSFQDMPAL